MRNLFVGAAAVTLLVAGLAWSLVPPRYEAFALLRVADKRPTVMANSGESAEAFSIFKRTQVQLMLSGSVLRRTVGEPEIAKLPTIKSHGDDPAAWLRSQLIIDNPDDSEILRVAMKGTNKVDLIAIVNMVVRKYLLEIVAHERDERLRHEAQLEKTYQAYSDKFTKDMDALHQQEQVAKIATTEGARLARKLAEEQLNEAIENRKYLARKIIENAIQIRLEQSRKEIPENTKTADTGVASDRPANEAQSLPLLEKQKEFLEEAYEQTELQIEKAAERMHSLESFSSTVAARQEDLVALKRIMNDLRQELEHLRLERQAPERITKVDDAVVAPVESDAVRRNLGLGLAVFVSLGLLAVGMSLGRARGA